MDSTPRKIDKPEQEVQWLQNLLVMGQAPENVAGLCDVDPLLGVVDGRTVSMGFSCLLPDNS